MATYKFFPPTRQEGPGVPLDHEDPIAHRLFPTRLQGISLVKSGGLFVEKRTLSEADYGGKVNGVDYFIGGYRYSGISQAVADILIASGYTPEVE